MWAFNINVKYEEPDLFRVISPLKKSMEDISARDTYLIVLLQLQNRLGVYFILGDLRPVGCCYFIVLDI